MNRIRYAVLLMAGLLFMVSPCVPAQTGSPDPRPELSPCEELSVADPKRSAYNIPEFLERQHECSLHAVDMLLREVRPALDEPLARRVALLSLDEATHYHDPDSRHSAGVRSFLKRRLDVAAYEMENTRVERGAVIWKLYNHTFVVRTASVTFAFDLTRGYDPDADQERITQRIIDNCDALFISHEHGDHNDSWVIGRFRAQGKPVINPGDFARNGITRHMVRLSGNRRLRVVIFPGYQGGLINDVPLVYTPEGMTFAHTGDLSSGSSTPIDMWEWIDRVKDRHSVDVLMVNNWTTDLPRVVRGFSPRLVIPGHENEMTHGIDQRKPHWMSYDRLRGLEFPSVVMAWGESYYYPAVPRTASDTAR